MLLRIINRAEEGIIAFLLVFMTLLVVMDVVMRFGFGSGFLWTQELTLYTSAWFVLFGISYGLKVGAHIGVDAVIRLLPEGPRKVASMLAVVLCLAYCGLFLYGGWIYIEKMYKLGIAMEDLRAPMWLVTSLSEQAQEALKLDIEDPLLPLWFTQGILLVGMVLFAIRLFELLWNVATGKSEGFRHVDEAEESMHLADELKAGDKEASLHLADENTGKSKEEQDK